MKPTTRRLTMAAGLAVLAVGLVVPLVVVQAATEWVVGELFVSVSGGGYQVRDKNNPSIVKQTVDAPGGMANGTTAGCAFDSLFNLVGAYFDATNVWTSSGYAELYIAGSSPLGDRDAAAHPRTTHNSRLTTHDFTARA